MDILRILFLVFIYQISFFSSSAFSKELDGLQTLSESWSKILSESRLFIIPVDRFDPNSSYSFSRFVKFFEYKGLIIEPVTEFTPLVYAGKTIDCPYSKVNLPVPRIVAKSIENQPYNFAIRAMPLDEVRAEGVLLIGSNAPYFISILKHGSECKIQSNRGSSFSECKIFSAADLPKFQDDINRFKNKLGFIPDKFAKSCLKKDTEVDRTFINLRNEMISIEKDFIDSLKGE